MHKPSSIYDDEPAHVYDFPRQYLKAMNEAIGDWIIYYEPVKAGLKGYFAVAKVSKIVPKENSKGRFLALIEPSSFLPFDRHVPRLINGRPLEQSLIDPSGLPRKGGAVQLAVRRLADQDFERIVDLGLPENLMELEERRYEERPSEWDDEPLVFSRPVIERLSRRPYRDVAFRRKVREAYGYRCAVSGLTLRNGGGRPEVQAAHIRPVDREGTDSVRNGLALSGTLHWMFDRGLISVADDCCTILVSRNKVPSDVAERLFPPSGKLFLPDDPLDHPHPENLKWHRENIFGQVVFDQGNSFPL